MAKVKDLEKALKIAEEGAKIARAEKKAMRMSEALDPHVGKRLYITQADRMALDPSKGYLGGSGFVDLATMLPEYKGMAWAVKTPGIAKTMVGSMARNPEEAIWTNLQGSPAQHRSNQVVFDKLMNEFSNAVEEGKLTPELRNKINKKLASIKISKTDVPMFPSDIDILSPDFAKHAKVFHKRREIASILGGEGVGGKKGSIIPYEKIIEETTDPLVKDVETGSIGNRLFSLSGDIFPDRPDIHTAYPTALGGERLSDVFTPAPQDIVLKEVIKNYNRKPTYYDLTRGYAPSVRVTDEMLEDLYKSGYAGGGAIKAASKLAKTAKKTAYELAHEKAQKNAVKMLGLPPNNTAMDRARAMGFDVDNPMYHGTTKDFPTFDPEKTNDIGFHFGTPEQAENINKVHRGWKAEFTKGDANILPVYLKTKNALRTGDMSNWSNVPTIMKDEGIIPKDIHEAWRQEGNKDGSIRNWSKLSKKLLQDQGYDSIVYENRIESPTGKVADSTIVLDPKHIRSRFAAFDPAEAESADILKAGGGPIKALEKAIRVGEESAKQTLKKAKDYKPVKSELSELAKDVENAKGKFGVRRLERALDTIPNLDKRFTNKALEEAFMDDNASSLLIMPPRDFEKYASSLPEYYGKSIDAIKFEGGKQVPVVIPPDKTSYLVKKLGSTEYQPEEMLPEDYFTHLGEIATKQGLNEVPYLKFDQLGIRHPYMEITGHEGRHRMRALDKLGDENALVRLWPNYSFREGMPRRTQEEYLQELENIFGQKSLVLPQKMNADPKRPLVRLPEFFAEGGTTYADGGSTHKQGKPLDVARGPRSTKSDTELLDEFRKDELSAKDYFKAVPTIAKTAGKMLKEQATEELPTYLEPRAIPDIALNALATGLGSISDIAHLGTGVERPVLGSEQLMDLLSEYGITSGTKRPLAENLLAIASPKVLRSAEKGLNVLRPALERPFTPLTTTVEAVAPDLAKFRPKDFQEYVTNRMISSQYGGVPMNVMGDRVTKKLPAQGVYFNTAGELETNPMMAIDIPNVSDISKAKSLRSDIASAGKALEQESMAGIRFLPMATNKIEDATAILVKPKSGKITNEDVIKLGNEFGNSMVVSHNPRLGGVILAPFDKPSGELQTAQLKIKDLFGSDMNIKAGHSDLQRDRFYMPRSEYAKEGARRVPKPTKELRQELKKAEALRYREPSFLSDTTPLNRGIGD